MLRRRLRSIAVFSPLVLLSITNFRQAPAIIIRLLDNASSAVYDENSHYGSSTSYGVSQKTEDTSSTPNLCDSKSGKQMPELYLLGAPKAATTSLASELVQAGVQLPLDGNETETKFFEFVFWNQADRACEEGRRRRSTDICSTDIKKVKERWLDYMPSCSTDHRQPLADMSCRNLHTVNPLNSPTRDFENWTGLPATLRTVYGTDLKRVTFMAIFREPMSRMQSEWYFMGYNREYAMKYYGYSTFSKTLERIYIDWKNAKFFWRKYWTGFPREELLWRTLYGNHMQQWLKDIPADQFIVFPYKEYTDGNKLTICTALSKRLKYSIDCPSKSAVVNVNGKYHPKLEDDISSDLLERFRRALADDEGALVSSLAKLHQEGGVLPNYNGKNDVHSIREWLRASW